MNGCKILTKFVIFFSVFWLCEKIKKLTLKTYYPEKPLPLTPKKYKIPPQEDFP